MSNGEPVESGPAVNIKGEFLSFLEVQCPIPESNVMKGRYFKKIVLIKYFSEIINTGLTGILNSLFFLGPSAKGFKISITSDGQIYSQEALFIVADGYCTKCTADGICTDNVSRLN